MNDINTQPVGSGRAFGTAATPPGQARKSATDEVSRTRSNADTPAVEVTLSEEAQAVLTEDTIKSPGKSKAHEARASLAMDEFKALADLPFGKVVSTLARGLDLSTLLPAEDDTPSDGDTITATDNEEAGTGDVTAANAATTPDTVTATGPEDTILAPISDEEAALQLLTTDTEA